MFDLVSICRLLNFITALVFVVSDFILIVYDKNYTSIIGFCYILLSYPALLWVLLNQNKITSIVNIRNPWYHILGMLFYNFGMFYICLSNQTLGPGLFLIIMGIFNILMGVFQDTNTNMVLDDTTTTE